MGTPQTILLVIDRASIGGGQQHVLDLAERMTARGLKVAVACEARGYLVDKLYYGKIPHHAVRLSANPSLRGLADLAKVIRASGAQVVHTHGGTAGFYGRIAARWVGGVRTVHTYHGIHYLRDNKIGKFYLHRAIDRILLRWTDEIICVAKSDRDLALSEKLARRDHVTVIYNGIDHAQFEMNQSDRRGPTRRNEHFVVGTVGRLHEQKGQIYLLQAAALIRQANPHVRFRIIGDGPLRKSLEAQSRVLGVDKIVDFLGARNDVPAQLRQLDLFILPSLWEGLPYVLIEAMAAGLPIVTTDFDGVREVIAGGGEGIVVPRGNAEALAVAIIDLMRDDIRRANLGENGAQAVRRRFSVDAMIEQTMSVYSRAMDT